MADKVLISKVERGKDWPELSMSKLRDVLNDDLEAWGNARWWHGYNTAKSEMLDKEKGE